MWLSLSRGVLPRQPLSGLSLGSFPELCFAFVLLQFPDETLRSSELLNMIVAVIDSFQVRRGPALGFLASSAPWRDPSEGAGRQRRLLQVSLSPFSGFAEP